MTQSIEESLQAMVNLFARIDDTLADIRTVLEEDVSFHLDKISEDMADVSALARHLNPNIKEQPKDYYNNNSSLKKVNYLNPGNWVLFCLNLYSIKRQRLNMPSIQ